MAVPAPDPSEPVNFTLWDELESTPGRLNQALRLALIAALTLYLLEYYRIPEPALSLYMIFFMTRMSRAESLMLAFTMVVTVLVIVATVIGLATVVLDSPFWRVISMALLSFVMLFLTAASRLKPLGASIALVAAYALSLLGSVQLGELATRGLLYVCLMIAIPAGVAITLNGLLAPGPSRRVTRVLMERYRVIGTLLGSRNRPSLKALIRLQDEGNQELNRSIRRLATKRSSCAEGVHRMQSHALMSLEMLSLTSSLIAHRTQRDELVSLRLSQYFLRLAGELERDQWRAPQGFPLEKRELAAASRPVQELLEAFNAAMATRGEGGALPDESLNRREKRRFLAEDAWTNPLHLQFALKTTAAAMTCYLVYMILDWPGIHTCFITCYIVSLGTVGETAEKLTLRILGCLLGAALGVLIMLFLVPDLSSIEGLMGLVFLGVLGSGWIAAGSSRISYAGFQVAFAFLLCVVQGSSPDFDLVIARDRVFGILLGNIVSYLFAVKFWPVSLTGRFDETVHQLLWRLQRLMEKGGEPKRSERLWEEVYALMAAAKLDLEMIRLEPSAVRGSETLYRYRRQLLEGLEPLLGPLYLIERVDPEHGIPIAGQLEQLVYDPLSYEAESAQPQEPGRPREPSTRKAREGRSGSSYFVPYVVSQLRLLVQARRQRESFVSGDRDPGLLSELAT